MGGTTGFACNRTALQVAGNCIEPSPRVLCDFTARLHKKGTAWHMRVASQPCFSVSYICCQCVGLSLGVAIVHAAFVWGYGRDLRSGDT